MFLFKKIKQSQFIKLAQLLVLVMIFVAVPTVSVFADGEAGSALSFDGVDDYVWLGSTDDIMGPGWEDTKSVSLWIKPEGSAVTCFNNDPGQCDTIFGDRPVWWGISRGIINGEDRIWVWNNATDNSTSFDLVGVKYTSGEWLHVAMVHDNGYLTVYKNGELIDSIASGTTEQPAPVQADPVLHLGAVIKSANDNWSYQGQIDEVRIYHIALSQAQIQNDLFNEITGDDAGLAAYYRMSDGAGLVLSDDRVLPGGAPVPDPIDGQLLQSEYVSPSVPPPPQWVASTAFDKPVTMDQFVSTDEDVPVAVSLFGRDPQGDVLTFDIVIPPENGSLSGTGASLTYTPAPNYFGSDSFTYTVSDLTHTSAVGVISITVDPVNDRPVADDISLITNVNTPVDILLTAVDLEDPVLSFHIISPPAHGILNGTFPTVTYTPQDGYFGTDSFSFSAEDSQKAADEGVVTITINDPPVAEDLVISTQEDTMVGITLMSTDPESDAVTYHYDSMPTQGTLTGILPNLTYTPNADANGSDSFTYYASDAYHDGPTAVVSITIDAVNDAPLAESQTLTIEEDTPYLITLAGSDVDGDSFDFTIVGNPEHGDLTGTAPHLIYTPHADYFGADSFTFRTNDGLLNSGLATITLEVIPVNDAPVADNQSVTAIEDTPILITLIANDVDEDALTYAILTTPSHGILEGSGANWTYTPSLGFRGVDQFTFNVTDGELTSNTATVSILVVEFNDPPTADDQNLTTDEDTPLSITLTGSDPEGVDLIFDYSQPANGTVSGTAPNVIYTPDENYNGSDQFMFTVSDGVNLPVEATVTITVDPISDRPVAAADTYQVYEDEVLLVAAPGVLENDLDGDGDTLTAEMVDDISDGTLVFNADGSFTYTPRNGFIGEDSFTYLASDGGLHSETVMVTITVLPGIPVTGDFQVFLPFVIR